LIWFFLSLLFILIAVWVFIETPSGQNWIARQVTKRLSRDLQTKVSIKHVDFSLFNRMHLEGVLVEDRDKDTLLYAKDMQVRITDWFFLKKDVVLKFIRLEDAVIKFQRTDSTWRQQFVFDYFNTPSSTRKKKAGISFDLKIIELVNVSFIKKDAWLGEDMNIRVGQLYMDAKKVDFSEKTFDINVLNLVDPYFYVTNYTKRKNTNDANDEPNDTSRISWNSNNWKIVLDELYVRNGRFRTDKQGSPLLAHFDGKHIDFTNINGELTGVHLLQDTIYSRLKLQAIERSGLVLRNLESDFKMAPDGMSLTNMDLQTNRSTIRNSFSMSFRDFSEMGDFIHKVKMNAIFDDADIHSDDIAFFAPAMRTWNRRIKLNGKVRGTVDDLVGKDLVVEAGSNSFLSGDVTLTGLPDINTTFIDLKANTLRTTYSDAVTFIPAVRRVTSPDLRKIHYITFNGSFTGFIRDFVTFGYLQTNLGDLQTDLNMKLPRGQDPIYSGTFSTANFRLGELLDAKKLGSIAISGTVKGKGFSDRSRNAAVDAKIDFVDLNDYRYKNIVVKGTLNKKLFDGNASINDENAELELNGILDFNNATPSFDLIADVKHANLNKLKLTDNDLALKGHFNLDFTGNDIDNFTGTARISNAELTRNGNRLPFDSLVLTSYYADNVKTLTVASNEFNGLLEGDFNIKALPDAFQLFLNKYYPAYIKPPRRYYENQSLKFAITTQFVDDYVKLIDSSLSGFNYSQLEGNLDLGRNELNLTADVPQFKYKQYSFDNVKFNAKGDFQKLVLNGTVGNVFINDSLNIPQAVFSVTARNDSSQVNILTGAGQALDKANLNALVLTYYDGVKIEFNPSSFNVNGKTWAIDESGELELRKRTPASGLLTLRESDQRITLRTTPSASGQGNDLKVELYKVNIGDVSPYFIRKNRLEGLVSGNFLVENITGKIKVTSNDIQTEFLRFDNDSLGAAKANLVYDDETKHLVIKGSTLNEENFLGFDANVFFDPAKQKDNRIALTPRNFQIKILERFLGTLFTDMRGFLTGNININGEFTHLSITGKGRLKNAGLKVNFTQVFYDIADTDIELKSDEINLDGLVLTDTVTGNPVYVNGSILHESFKDMFYDIYLSTRKPNTTGDDNNRPVLLLNTTFKNNKQFFGRVKGTGSLSLAGPQSNMFMKIDAIASNRDSSWVTLPNTRSRESGIADFLIERKYGREMSDSDLRKGSTNISYDVDVTANPMVTVKVVLDDLTGDEIKGRGSGSLNIRSGTTEPLSLRGKFDIEEGNYLFTFQSFFKKPFELRKGSDNYIEWNGDPYKARINFDAVYTAEKISFAPLGSLSPGTSAARGDVYVILSLTGELFKPNINFALDFPPSSPAITDPALGLVLQQMQKNTNEMNKQVTYLIVFNSFAPTGLAESTSDGIGISYTISGILLDVISDQLNRLLSNLFKNDKYRINVNTSLYDRDIINRNIQLGSNVNFSIGRSFFNDRFIITVGSGFETVQESAVQQGIQILPDVTMEWLINKSGTIRATFFYRENTDYLTTSADAKNRRAGASLTYRRDFDKLSELFKKQKK
jgi:hypothetical protein